MFILCICKTINQVLSLISVQEKVVMSIDCIILAIIDRTNIKNNLYIYKENSVKYFY